MELGLFLDGLKTSLVNRGIPPEVAAKHVASLGRTFTEDDLTEIESIRSQSEIDQIADSIAAIIHKNKNPRTSSQTDQPVRETADAPDMPKASIEEVPAKPAGQPVRETAAASAEPAVRPQPIQQASPAQHAYDAEPVRYAQNSADFFKTPEGKDKTTKGVAIFWAVFLLTLPLTLALLAVILAVFGIVFLGLIVMIIGLVLGMIAVVAVGSCTALIGIIYGITQIFTFMAAGIYEIGLGVMIGGGVLLAGIILYNLAIRFLPWVMKWVTVLFTYVFGQIRNLFYLARRECYKL